MVMVIEECPIGVFSHFGEKPCLMLCRGPTSGAPCAPCYLLGNRLAAVPNGLDDAADRGDDNVWPFERNVVRRLGERERYVGNRGRQLLLRSAPRGIELFAKPGRHP